MSRQVVHETTNRSYGAAVQEDYGPTYLPHLWPALKNRSIDQARERLPTINVEYGKYFKADGDESPLTERRRRLQVGGGGSTVPPDRGPAGVMTEMGTEEQRPTKRVSTLRNRESDTFWKQEHETLGDGRKKGSDLYEGGFPGERRQRVEQSDVRQPDTGRRTSNDGYATGRQGEPTADAMPYRASWQATRDLNSGTPRSSRTQEKYDLDHLTANKDSDALWRKSLYGSSIDGELRPNSLYDYNYTLSSREKPVTDRYRNYGHEDLLTKSTEIPLGRDTRTIPPLSSVFGDAERPARVDKGVFDLDDYIERHKLDVGLDKTLLAAGANGSVRLGDIKRIDLQIHMRDNSVMTIQSVPFSTPM